jgi:hypothetical protein
VAIVFIQEIDELVMSVLYLPRIYEFETPPFNTLSGLDGMHHYSTSNYVENEELKKQSDDMYGSRKTWIKIAWSISCIFEYSLAGKFWVCVGTAIGVVLGLRAHETIMCE